MNQPAGMPDSADRGSRAARESDDRDYSTRVPHLRHLVRRFFPPDPRSRILDAGCGDGAFMRFLQTEGYSDVRGVDASHRQVERAKSRDVSGVIHGDMLDVLAGEPADSLDVIIAFDVLEHLQLDVLVAFAAETQRVLRLDGMLILNTVNAEGVVGQSMRWGDLTHERAFTRKSVEQLLLDAGYGRVACYENKPVVHGLPSLARRVFFELSAFPIRLWHIAETGSDGYAAILSRNLLAVARKRD